MYSFIKRCFDFIRALLALIVLSPLFLLTMIGILISDWGPVFYKANRIGKGNKPFRMYKFRSMRVLKAPKKGAEASLRPDEDRIFPFGHFIRKAKIDELPQLINILNGTMSIIGPRPVAEDQFDMFRYGKWNEAAKVPVGLRQCLKQQEIPESAKLYSCPPPMAQNLFCFLCNPLPQRARHHNHQSEYTVLS